MITSTSNARVKRLVNLRKKRKARDEEGVFLVEGIRMFREVPVDKLREVYVSESFYKKEKETIEKVLAEGDIRAELVSDTVFSHIGYEDATGDTVRGTTDGSYAGANDSGRTAPPSGT